MKIAERSAGDVTILDLEGRLILDDGFEPLRLTLNRVIGEGRRKLLLNLDRLTRRHRLDRMQVRDAVPPRRSAEAVQPPLAQP